MTLPQWAEVGPDGRLVIDAKAALELLRGAAPGTTTFVLRSLLLAAVEPGCPRDERLNFALEDVPREDLGSTIAWAEEILRGAA